MEIYVDDADKFTVHTVVFTITKNGELEFTKNAYRNRK